VPARADVCDDDREKRRWERRWQTKEEKKKRRRREEREGLELGRKRQGMKSVTLHWSVRADDRALDEE
jgi:hypothetical protein